jgi:hypothetical protein
MGSLLLIILILLLLGAFPRWGYNRNWGYGPSGALGLLLVIVLILVLVGTIHPTRPIPSLAEGRVARVRRVARSPGPDASIITDNSVFQSPLSSRRYVMKMRPLVLSGLILVVLGLAALAVPTFTFFTTERVGDVGFFKIDISRPHTIVFNPIVGGIALAAGIVLVLVGLRSGSA